jgi:hypothetical protein
MPKEFRGHPHDQPCSNEGLVYAPPIANANRIHVRHGEGKFLKEFKLAEHTGVGGGGRAGWGFTRQEAKRFLYILGPDEQPHLLLNREDGREVGAMGSIGRERRLVLRDA